MADWQDELQARLTRTCVESAMGAHLGAGMMNPQFSVIMK